MITERQITDEQVLTAVAECWKRRETFNATPGRRFIALGVMASEVASRLGFDRAPARRVAPRLAKLTREGRLTRAYDERAGDQGCFVYRPAA